jgi:hypothetical protein
MLATRVTRAGSLVLRPQALWWWLGKATHSDRLTKLVISRLSVHMQRLNIMRNKIEDIIVTILCLAVFAGWGVLLALGI